MAGKAQVTRSGKVRVGNDHPSEQGRAEGGGGSAGYHRALDAVDAVGMGEELVVAHVSFLLSETSSSAYLKHFRASDITGRDRWQQYTAGMP